MFDGSSTASRRPGDTAEVEIARASEVSAPVESAFWDQIAKGLLAEEAAAVVGVAPAVATRWYRHGGGMRPFDPTPSSGRYLSFREREEIALLKDPGRFSSVRLGPRSRAT